MKLLLIEEDGTLLATIEHVEEYNVSKSLGRASLMDEVVSAIEGAH